MAEVELQQVGVYTVTELLRAKFCEYGLSGQTA